MAFSYAYPHKIKNPHLHLKSTTTLEKAGNCLIHSYGHCFALLMDSKIKSLVLWQCWAIKPSVLVFKEIQIQAGHLAVTVAISVTGV